MSKSVCVLLSTYNGEKYLAEQLDSILSQRDISLRVLIRDDGSNDNTINIIRQYNAKDNRIEYYVGDNLGPAQSFLDLLNNAPHADYYSFSDQDDFWDSDKLSIAVSQLDKLDSNKPGLYYSNLRIVDESLSFYRYSHSAKIVPKTKYSSLVESLPTGCTMVFNACAEELMRNRIPKMITMHDTWVYMVCMIFGTCIYDFEAHISYRQHGNNVIGTPLSHDNALLCYINRVKRLFDRSLQPRYTNANSFYNSFDDMLSGNDRKMVEKVAFYKQSLRNWIGLLFDKEIEASTKSRNMRNKVLILLRLI